MNAFKKIYKALFGTSEPDGFVEKPINYKFKVYETSASGLYYLKYSTNGGIFWKPIYCAKQPFLGILSYDWEWGQYSMVVNNLREDSFDEVKEMFSTHEKVLKFMEKEKAEFEIKDKKHRAERNEHNNRKNSILNKINNE